LIKREPIPRIRRLYGLPFFFMATNLSEHFRHERLVLGLTIGEAARLLGYRSVVGAANKIVRFEQGGDIDHRLFRKVAAVLFVDKGTIRRLMKKDRREFVQRWNEWVSQSVKPRLIAEILNG
jgi:hypothetical protein